MPDDDIHLRPGWKCHVTRDDARLTHNGKNTMKLTHDDTKLTHDDTKLTHNIDRDPHLGRTGTGILTSRRRRARENPCARCSTRSSRAWWTGCRDCRGTWLTPRGRWSWGRIPRTGERLDRYERIDARTYTKAKAQVKTKSNGATRTMYL